MANALPWSKWFWESWEADEALEQCSLAAQGLWMRILCRCAKGEPYGTLTVKGSALDMDGIARAAGRPAAEVAPLLAELETWGVFSRDRKGRIYCRRMVRDAKKIRTAQRNGKKGGNPALCAASRIPPSDNPGSGTGITPFQSPEARRQRKKGSPPPGGENPSSGAKDAGTGAPARQARAPSPDGEIDKTPEAEGRPATAAAGLLDDWMAAVPAALRRKVRVTMAETAEGETARLTVDTRFFADQVRVHAAAVTTALAPRRVLLRERGRAATPLAPVCAGDAAAGGDSSKADRRQA